MADYGENAQQGKFWNKAPGQSLVDNDTAMNERLSLISDILISGLSLDNIAAAMDIGCGAGDSTRQLASRLPNTAEVTGFDISDALLARAQALNSTADPSAAPISYKQADIQAYPFPPQEYDLAISRFGVMFFDNPVKAFSNIRTGLGHGAKLDFVCWAALEENEFFSHPAEIANRLTGSTPTLPGRDPGPMAFSDKDYLHQILVDAGFAHPQIDTVKTFVQTADSAEDNADLLMTIGKAASILREAEADEAIRAEVREALRTGGLERTRDGLISYDATIYRVSVTA